MSKIAAAALALAAVALVVIHPTPLPNLQTVVPAPAARREAAPINPAVIHDDACEPIHTAGATGWAGPVALPAGCR